MDRTLADRAIVDALRSGSPVRWVLRGGSMWPAVRDGARVAVTPGDAPAVRAGELVAYARQGAVVVHRVVAATAGGVRCRGDALPVEDAVVPWADVLGRAVVLDQRPLTLRAPRWRELPALVRAALGRLRMAIR